MDTLCLKSNMTEDEINNDIKEYKSLLDSGVKEEVIHQFLAEHAYFFNGTVRTFGHSPMYSKVKLGDDYETDFCYMDPTSFGPVWNFIELERPDHRLFTKNGDETSELKHGIRQVRDWNEWVSENKKYAEKLMPLIAYPQSTLIIGRRRELTENPKLMHRLKRINYELRMSMEIRTFDSLASNAESILKLARENKGIVHLSMPMKALTHRQLKDGLPEVMRTFMDHHKSDLDEGGICRKLEEGDRENIRKMGFDHFNMHI